MDSFTALLQAPQLQHFKNILNFSPMLNKFYFIYFINLSVPDDYLLLLFFLPHYKLVQISYIHKDLNL